MKLLEALVSSVQDKEPKVPGANMVYFAFSEDGDENAFLSEIELDELVPMLEEWCKRQRQEMRLVH